MKYHIKTYGCQMNKSDSERIAGVLEKAGYIEAVEESDADLIVLNMCSVRKSAVDRIAGNFKKYNRYKKNNPNLKTIITGCILESDRKRFEKLFDLVIDIKKIKELPEILKNYRSEFQCYPESDLEFIKNSGLTIPLSLKLSAIKKSETGNKRQNILKQAQNDNNKTLRAMSQNDKNDYFYINPQYQSRITAYVPIMTGCNNFCSYCVVPYTRGREYSRPAEEIIGEIVGLVDSGYKEIVLLGQNVNSYKSRILCHSALDTESSITQNHPTRANCNNKTNLTMWIPAKKVEEIEKIVDFPKLLKSINNIPGGFWIRFLTSHPKDMTEELIKTVVECEKCTEYVHLALQSGDDEILKKMNRKYTAKHFLNLVRMIRKYMPDAAITTDIIVGFPGETEKQFQNTAEAMEKAKFDMIYINKYSPREETASAKMKDDVSWQEKKRREKVLTEILKKTALENNQKYIGKTIDILVEKIDNKFIYGKTRGFKNVKIELRNRNASLKTKRLHSHKRTMEPMTDQELGIKEGQFMKIKITQASAWGLEGKVVK